MVLNAAVQMLREADDLKLKILKFKSGTSMLQERSLWVTQQQLQKVYQKVLVLDLDYALYKKVEQDLWNIGFKQQIEALQSISKDKKNPLRSEGQAMLSWVLQAAAGFYLCLLHQICTTFKLDLPFRRRASLLGCVEGWGAGSGGSVAGVGGGGGGGGAGLPPPVAARYICQHCLVHLGDLARYRQQLRVAHSFYRHALVVSAHSGQPYNQLALVAWRRGRRLAALYWHVRSLLVRTPFPPAADNLARTLRAAADCRDSKELPVLPGVGAANAPPPAAAAAPAPSRLDAHSYITELIRALHMIHTLEDLESAAALVGTLNSSLTALVATDSFESTTLIKMSCLLMWLVHASTEGLAPERAALSEPEAEAAALAESLAAAALQALLLPAYTRDHPPPKALPALLVWLQWVASNVRVCGGAAWAARPQLWPALAHVLNALDAPPPSFRGDAYDTMPLPEDEELHGFLPLEEWLEPLRFPNHAAWDTYGGRVPDVGQPGASDHDDAAGAAADADLERRVRTHRLRRAGRRLADQCPRHLGYSEEDGRVTFAAPCAGGEAQLSRALRELEEVAARGAADDAAGGEGGGAGDGDGELEEESEDERAPPPPPVVISEADFREKVREKRVGILKPQGSLERAREERALASAADRDDQEPEASEEGGRCEEKKEARKPRVNIAMAAIMRKQEETNKQVKFVTPPPTPDLTTDAVETAKEQEAPKVLQPKVIKSLANLPLGRKTGGILSLKDKSAGYPHLVNVEPEPAKKPDKEDKKELKMNQGSSQNSQQSYQPKRADNQPSPSWAPKPAAPSTFADQPRMGFLKSYGTQAGGGFNASGQQAAPGAGIRLPVVNPKEIDVRTAAMQKQNARFDQFPEGHKFAAHNYQLSGDKKNFLNDLPPRFANQYRQWHNAQENRYTDNKFRDESTPQHQQQQQGGWPAAPPDRYQQQASWWKPDNPPPTFNTSYPPPPLTHSLLPNFYSSQVPATNPYRNVPSYSQSPNQTIGPSKQENDHAIAPPKFMQPNLGLQGSVTSPNFNSSLGNFGSYAPSVGYDSSMYPQFGNQLGYGAGETSPQVGYQGGTESLGAGGLGFSGNLLDLQRGGVSMAFGDALGGGAAAMKRMDAVGTGASAAPTGYPGDAAAGVGGGSTYSLFSGAADGSPWGGAARPQHSQHQSLWSGPGPSPLERLLEQQKQLQK